MNMYKIELGVIYLGTFIGWIEGVNNLLQFAALTISIFLGIRQILKKDK
jgi:hypothetical protein